MEFVTGTIHRDVMTEPVVTVVAWEVPVLEARTGHDLVEVTRFDEAGEPDPAAEYTRLEKVYGVDPRSGISFVERVYGPLSSGALVRAMKAAGAIDEDSVEVVEMDREELMRALDEAGIEYPKKVSNKRLTELYASIERGKD